MERLSGLDASFLYLENPTHHMHVALTLVFDPSTVPGGYSFEKMQRHIEQRALSTPVFRRRLVEVPLRLGHPVWIDDPDFDIDYHVRRTAVPAPGGLDELAALAGEIAGHQLDRGRPLWEMWVVEGMAGGNIGFIAKMHHATVDGMSGAALLSVLFDLEVGTPAATATLTQVPVGEALPAPLGLLGGAMASRATLPLTITRDLVKTGLRILDVRRVRQEPGKAGGHGKAALPLSAPRTSFNVALTRRRNVALAAIGLDDVKRLKNATGTTVNDVVLAVCTGALRQLLLTGDELPDKPLVGVVPVSVRPEDLPGRTTEGSNQVSSMFIGMPTQLHNPIDRLMAVREGTKGAKAEHNALGADMLLNWAEYAAPNVFANAARAYSRMQLANRHRPIANLVISNVPGPDFPLYLAGAEMQACFPLGPCMDGMGLNVTIMSYRGVLYWGFISCPEVLPRLWELADAIPTALEELLEAAQLAPPEFRSADADAALGSMIVTTPGDVDDAHDAEGTAGIDGDAAHRNHPLHVLSSLHELPNDAEELPRIGTAGRLPR